MNLFHYIDKYGNYTFKNKEFNDIDNLIFCFISYLNYDEEYINENIHSLHDIAKNYLVNHKYKDISKLGMAQKDAYKVLERIYDVPRYKNILVTDYIFDNDINMQFSAMSFHISKKLKFICFEGTDELVSGWKEDCHLACYFPVPAQKRAIEYVNKHTHLFGKKVIIGGHSKGGNLALVSGMYLKAYKQHKLLKIYSNDGPGLRRKEFESFEYQSIKDRLIHYVPETSIIGILLRNDVYNVVKTSKKYFLGHVMSAWKTDDDKLVEGNMSQTSIKLSKSIIEWLDNHNDEQRVLMIDNIFKVLEENNIAALTDLKKLNNIIKLIKGLKDVDKESKKLATDLLQFSFKNLIDKNYLK